MYENYEFPTGVLFFWLAIAVFMIAAMWKVFTKAGQPGWAVIILFTTITS